MTIIRLKPVLDLFIIIGCLCLLWKEIQSGRKMEKIIPERSQIKIMSE